MSAPESYSFTRYLTAKRSVDDRALNRHVWNAFVSALTAQQSAADHLLQVLEVGAGSGTMIERCLEHGLLTHCRYSAIDAEKTNIESAWVGLQKWAGQLGFEIIASATEGSRQLHVERKSRDTEAIDTVQIGLEAADMFEYAARSEQRQRYDMLIAHAFLDLVDVADALAHFSGMLRSRSLLYLTINFDGATILQPEIDPEFDALVEHLYHGTMDGRIVAGRPSGDSRTGRHLFGHLRAARMDILAAGGSDWVVHAGPGGYVGDEAYFLHFIVNTMGAALVNHPQLEPCRFQEWIRLRHEQIERGELVYIAHQLDFLARLQE